MHDQTIEQVQSFKFLSCKLMYWTIRRVMKGIAKLQSQLKLCNIMVVPTAIYGSQTWIIRKNHETRIETGR